MLRAWSCFIWEGFLWGGVSCRPWLTPVLFVDRGREGPQSPPQDELCTHSPPPPQPSRVLLSPGAHTAHTAHTPASWGLNCTAQPPGPAWLSHPMPQHCSEAGGALAPHRLSVALSPWLSEQRGCWPGRAGGLAAPDGLAPPAAPGTAEPPCNVVLTWIVGRTPWGSHRRCCETDTGVGGKCSVCVCVPPRPQSDAIQPLQPPAHV